NGPGVVSFVSNGSAQHSKVGSVFKSCSKSCRGVHIVVLVLFVLGSARLQAQFVAFNDHGPGVVGVTTHTNATTWNIFGNPPGASGPLKDVQSGLELPAKVTITKS